MLHARQNVMGGYIQLQTQVYTAHYSQNSTVNGGAKGPVFWPKLHRQISLNQPGFQLIKRTCTSVLRTRV